MAVAVVYVEEKAAAASHLAATEMVAGCMLHYPLLPEDSGQST